MASERPPSPAMTGAVRLLLMEDEPVVRKTLCRILTRAGYEVHEADTVASGTQTARRQAVDVAIVDHNLPDGTALDFLREMAESKVATIVLTGNGSIDLAVAAIKAGAENFVTKPVDTSALLALVEKARAAVDRERKLDAVARGGAPSFDPFIGTSPAIRRLRELAESTASADAPVLILGETGSGKGVLARWLHARSARRQQQLVELNCAGLAKDLVESDLFGHEKGSFTGAHATKRGLLEVAHRGTLFLDEIGDLDLQVQPKLLKVLEDRVYRRVGSVESRAVDVRLIAATHKNLNEMIAAGSFRNDLFFRVNTLTFVLPSLNERREDIAPLTDCILEDLCHHGGVATPIVTERARRRLHDHEYTGNLRELRNILERALLFHRGPELSEDALDLPKARGETLLSDSRETLVDMEKAAIEKALERVGGNVAEAAVLLKVPRSSLYVKLKKYGIRTR